MNILIVDDRPDNILTFRTILDSSGNDYNILESDSVVSGIELARDNSIECILLNMHLPDIQGELAFHSFFTEFPSIPIILINQIKDDRKGLKLMEMGAQDFLYIKNLTDTQLLKSIHYSTRRIKTDNELRELNSMKDKFFSIMAHDLKNPLSVLNLTTDNLLKEFNKLKKAEIKDYLIDLNDHSRNIYRLLDNLMIWSRIQRKIIKFTPDILPLKFLVENSISIFEVEAKAKRIKIKKKSIPDIKLYSDSFLLGTILNNFISNAIKYSHPEQSIEVSTKISPKTLEIIVKDSGLGMDDKTIENLYIIDRQRSMPGTLDEEGTGLGLIVSKDFSDLMSGKIEIDTKFGKGSTFKLIIPNVPVDDH